MIPSHHTPKLLHCIAPDGEHVTEKLWNDPFPDTDAAWRWSSDMGSRWFFYPIHVVTSIREIIADVPDGMPKEWIGKRLTTLKNAISAHSQHVCDWINGKTPFCIWP